MSEEEIYNFDMSKLTLDDYLTCVNISLDPRSRESYLAFLGLIKRTLVGFDIIPLSEMAEVQRQFMLRLDAHFATLLTVEGFLDAIANAPDEEEPDAG